MHKQELVVLHLRWTGGTESVRRMEKYTSTDVATTKEGTEARKAIADLLSVGWCLVAAHSSTDENISRVLYFAREIM